MALIPVQLSETEFTAFIFPHLSMPKRGPKPGLPSVFNLILWILYTGKNRSGSACPCRKTPMGNRPFNYDRLQS